MLTGNDIAPPRVPVHVRTGQDGRKLRIQELRRIHPIGGEHLYHPTPDGEVRMQGRLDRSLEARLHASLDQGDCAVRYAKRDAVGLPSHLPVQRHRRGADDDRDHLQALSTARSAGSGKGENIER